MFPLEVIGRLVIQPRMPPAGVVPTLDPGKDRQTCLSLCLTTTPGNQLALETGKETLSHGVVIGIAHRAHRRPYTHFLEGWTSPT